MIGSSHGDERPSGLGRDIAYRDIPDRAWADAVATRLNPHALAHLSKLGPTSATCHEAMRTLR